MSKIDLVLSFLPLPPCRGKRYGRVLDADAGWKEKMRSRHPVRDPTASSLELAQLKRLRIASVVKATTLLLLVGIAVPLKRLAGQDIAVRVVGPVHGLAFASYLWVALRTVSGSDWERRGVGHLLLAAVVPFGGVLVFRAIGSRMARLRKGAVV